MTELSAFDHVAGLVGSRAIVYFAGSYFSPVYGTMRWTPTNDGRHVTEVASCAIGCATVPSERHQGCGFHAHFLFSDTQQFVEQIRGTADCIVLVECAGRVVTHEKGFRAEKAKIIAVVDWDPRVVFFTFPSESISRPNVASLATKYFSVPMIDPETATWLIERQKTRLLDDPNISFQSRGI